MTEDSNELYRTMFCEGISSEYETDGFGDERPANSAMEIESDSEDDDFLLASCGML